MTVDVLPGDQFFTICLKLYKSMTGYSQAPLLPTPILKPKLSCLLGLCRAVHCYLRATHCYMINYKINFNKITA